MAKVVEVAALSKILPSNLEECSYFLSNLDIVLPRDLYMGLLYYYQGSAHLDLASAAASLSKSLCEVLQHYPIFCGKVVIDDHKRPTVVVDANSPGAILVEASANVNLSEWEDLKDVDIELDLLPLKHKKITEEDPLLKIQVTRFKCGGISIGVLWGHIIADGQSATEFVKAWSEIHMGKSISTPPKFVAGLIGAQNPPNPGKSMEKSDYAAKKIREVSSVHTARVALSFTSIKVANLVKEVENGAWGYGRATSYECLAALAWKLVAEAKSVSGATPAKFLNAINCRGRWTPALPKGYFGNAISSSCTEGHVAENHVSYAARLIHEMIQQNDPQYFQSLVDWIQQTMDLGDTIPAVSLLRPDPGRTLQLVSFVGFAVSEVEFGWGVPIHFSVPVLPHYGPGTAFITQRLGHDPRARFMCLALPPSLASKFLTNPLLLKFQS